MLFCASIIIISCNKETSDMTNANGIQTPKSSLNSITLDEAQETFARVSKEAKTSLTGGTSLNIADFDPQWQDVISANFTDTTGNLLAVPMTIFQAGGYKKLFFMRHNGQVSFLVLTVKGTAEYLIRTNGHCTMNDFSGDIYFTNANGVHTGGYKLNNGQVVAWLVPSTRPRPEFEDVDKDGGIFDEVVITASPLPSNSGTPYYGNVDFGNNLSYSSLMNNDFRAGGGGGSNSGSTSPPANGMAEPIIDSTYRLCPSSFVFTPKKTLRANTDGTTYTVVDNTIYTCGFKNLAVDISYTRTSTGLTVPRLMTLSNLFIVMPGVGGNAVALGVYSSKAFEIAREQTIAAMSANNSSNPNLIFATKFFEELRKQEALYLTGHQSPNISNSILCNTASAADQIINYGTTFTVNYTTCR